MTGLSRVPTLAKDSVVLGVTRPTEPDGWRHAGIPRLGSCNLVAKDPGNSDSACRMRSPCRARPRLSFVAGRAPDRRGSLRRA
jgi:hypothetical protein